jgi:hypothetical protein
MTRARTPRPLRFDRLEARDNPTGAVTAVQVGDVLTLTGDDLDNAIQVSNVNNDSARTTVTVTGQNGTLIGNATSKTFEKVRALKIVMNGGNDAVTTNPAAGEFEFWGPVGIDLGDGNNSLTLDPAGRLYVENLTVKAGDGFDAILVNGDPASTKDDLFNPSFNLGDGGADVSLNSFAAVGPLKVKAGHGAESLALNNVTLTVLNTADKPAPLTAQFGDGPASVTLSTGGLAAGALKVGPMAVTASGDIDVRSFGPVSVGSMSINAGPTGLANVTLDDGAAIKGDLTARGNTVDLGVGPGDGLSVGGNLNLLGRSDAALNLSAAGAVTVGHGLTVQAAGGSASVLAGGAGVTVGGNLAVTGGVGTSVEFSTTGPSRVKGNASVRGGTGDDLFAANAQFAAAHNLTLALGGGANGVFLAGAGADPEVGGNLSITTGAGADVVTLDHVRVAGRTAVRTGAGADQVSILAGSTFLGPTMIDLGSGDDVLAVAPTPPAPGGGAVTFQGKLTARAGAGNDTVSLGVKGGGADTSIVFGSAGNAIDGGTGQDLFDAQAGQFDATKLTAGSVVDPTP